MTSLSGNPFTPGTVISDHDLNAAYVKVLRGEAHLLFPGCRGQHTCRFSKNVALNQVKVLSS